MLYRQQAPSIILLTLTKSSGCRGRDAPDRSLDRVFLEETRDHRRIEIGSHLVDGVADEVDDPAIPVVEP